MNNMIGAKLKSISLVMLAVLMSACVALGCISLQSTQFASAMNTAEGTVSINNGADIYNAATGKFDKKGIYDLLIKLGKGVGASEDTKSYEALESAYSDPVTSANINTANGGDIVLTFGGYKWTVTYLSTTTSGDLIATLWYADTEDKYMFADGWFNTVLRGWQDANYYSSTYGRSVVRSSGLNIASDYYYLSNSATGQIATADVNAYGNVKTGLTQDSDHRFALFTMQSSEKGIGVLDYLATPSEVEWQADQQVFQYRYTNESYNVIETTADNGWHSDLVGQTFQEREGYSEWADDPIWIPSYTEAADGGLWASTSNQRSNDAPSWLRSGHYGNASSSYIMRDTGISNNVDTNNTLGVRPALHLNLKSAEAAAEAVDCTATLSYDTVPTVGGAAVSPTLTVKDGEDELTLDNYGYGTPTYTITSGEEFATIDSATGALTAIAGGSVTVQVTTEETYLYASTTASATVTIEEPDEPVVPDEPEPVEPDEPEPVVPEEPEPEVPAEPEPEPEKTGCGSTGIIVFVVILVAVVAVGAGVAIYIKKKRIL